MNPQGCARRARPLLGTLVEIGSARPDVIDAAFAEVAAVQACMSRFERGSDVARFNALKAGEWLDVDARSAEVLRFATALQRRSAGLFDITLGSARDGWQLDGQRLTRCSDDVQFDLGGIAKGYAVDRAVDLLRHAGCRAGWVNAGGDLRVFGDLSMPIDLRDERNGGVRRFGSLQDGALATSHFGAGSRSRLHGSVQASAGERHVSVAAPCCMAADALTKVVAATGDASHPLLAEFDATAWLHAPSSRHSASE